MSIRVYWLYDQPRFEACPTARENARHPQQQASLQAVGTLKKTVATTTVVVDGPIPKLSAVFGA